MKLTYLVLILIIIGLSCSEDSLEATKFNGSKYEGPPVIKYDITFEYTDGTKDTFNNAFVERKEMGFYITVLGYDKIDSVSVKGVLQDTVRYDTTYIRPRTTAIHYTAIKKFIVLDKNVILE